MPAFAGVCWLQTAYACVWSFMCSSQVDTRSHINTYMDDNHTRTHTNARTWGRQTDRPESQKDGWTDGRMDGGTGFDITRERERERKRENEVLGASDNNLEYVEACQFKGRRVY